MSRSLEKLTTQHLQRLGRIAADDHADLFRRKKETGGLYSQRRFAIALCQGGALHFIDGQNGIKDLDVWCFYTEAPERSFPYRRRAEYDFGDACMGQTSSHPHYVGRKVDVIGRSIPGARADDPAGSLQRYLRGGETESARQLARKAVVLIDPPQFLGLVIWPLPAAASAQQKP